VHYRVTTTSLGVNPNPGDANPGDANPGDVDSGDVNPHSFGALCRQSSSSSEWVQRQRLCGVPAPLLGQDGSSARSDDIEQLWKSDEIVLLEVPSFGALCRQSESQETPQRPVEEGISSDVPSDGQSDTAPLQPNSLCGVPYHNSSLTLERASRTGSSFSSI